MISLYTKINKYGLISLACLFLSTYSGIVSFIRGDTELIVFWVSLSIGNCLGVFSGISFSLREKKSRNQSEESNELPSPKYAEIDMHKNKGIKI